MTEKFEVGTVEVPEFEVVEEFTPPQDTQPYGCVQDVPLKAKIQRWGVELLWAHTPAYTGKILIRRGDPTYKGRVQYHFNKDETFYLLSGRCRLRWDAGDGQLSERIMVPGESVHIPRYARHSVIALEDCIFLEVSTPHFEDRQNVDEDYGVDGELDWHFKRPRTDMVVDVLQSIGAGKVEVVGYGKE